MKKICSTVCIIVDAYFTANMLAGLFKTYGYDSIHVQSSATLPTFFTKSFRPNDFLENIVYSGDIELLRLHLQQYHIKCVIAGAESGVELADQLSELLGTFSNGSQLSKARRNKYIMNETVRQAGLNAVNQLKSNDLNEILKWSHHNNYPVVVKPVSSMATDGFHICHNESELKKAFHDLYLSKNIFGVNNSELLVQDYLDGQEYAVNAVSFNGKHYIFEIWKTNKTSNGYSKTYDLETLVPQDNETFSILKNYVQKVLDALHIHYGPSHTEVILMQHNKPILVESASRFMGGLNVMLMTEAIGTNALLLTAEAFLNSETFLKHLDKPLPQIKKMPYIIQLISYQDGLFLGYSLEKLLSLETFYSAELYIEPNTPIKKTISSAFSLGYVALLSDSKINLERNYYEIRKMEKSGEIFKVINQPELA
jgi:biotin carboxylase